jgi:hypothetical protein
MDITPNSPSNPNKMESKTAEEILGLPFYPHECGSMTECATRKDALWSMHAFSNQQNAELVKALEAVMPYLSMVSSHVNLSDDSLEEFIEVKDQAKAALNSNKIISNGK